MVGWSNDACMQRNLFCSGTDEGQIFTCVPATSQTSEGLLIGQISVFSESQKGDRHSESKGHTETSETSERHKLSRLHVLHNPHPYTVDACNSTTRRVRLVCSHNTLFVYKIFVRPNIARGTQSISTLTYRYLLIVCSTKRSQSFNTSQVHRSFQSLS